MSAWIPAGFGSVPCVAGINASFFSADQDEILDFEQGEDAIELRGFAGLDDFGDLAGAFGAAAGTATIRV